MIFSSIRNRSSSWLIPFFTVCICIGFLSCMKQTTTQITITDAKPPVHIEAEGDTTTYIVSFPDEKELNTFTKKFNTLLDKYTFDTTISDTINNYFCLRLARETRLMPVDTVRQDVPIDKPVFTESDILTKDTAIARPDTTAAEIDTLVPQKGGKAVIYTEQKFLTYPLTQLVQTIPFAVDTPETTEVNLSPAGLFSVKQLSPKKIQLTCNDNYLNRSGKKVTAFSIVQSLTAYIKDNPAEGKALLYRVKGVKQFIKGEEAIIQGLTVTNPKTIVITLGKPDPQALERLNSPRLIPAALGIGPFATKENKSNKITLLQNPHFRGEQVYLNQCSIIFGNDKKPIISYSLNKYDIIVLYTKKDIEYANRSLLKNSYLMPYSTDRYFVSLAPASAETRAYLSKIISPQKIQKNAVRAEGELIQTIEPIDEVPLPEEMQPDNQKPAPAGPVSILYNADDPISLKIAERVYSDLSGAGTKGKLLGLSKRAVQNALIDKSYDVAIGWVPEELIQRTSERLRLAAIWFNGERDESKRLSENLEIPLFTVQKYALCKNHIKFYKNRLTGIFRQE